MSKVSADAVHELHAHYEIYEYMLDYLSRDKGLLEKIVGGMGYSIHPSEVKNGFSEGFPKGVARRTARRKNHSSSS